MLGLSDPGYDAAERMGIADALKAAQYLPVRLVHVTPYGGKKFALEARALEILAGERQLTTVVMAERSFRSRSACGKPALQCEGLSPKGLRWR
jgi:hypothetical protein